MVWLTTSKNADAELKKNARSLASALPECEYVGRGARTISRIDRMAQKRDVKNYLVLGRSNIDGKPMLLSRHYVDDGDTCMWMWQPKRMEKFAMKCTELEEPSEPYEFEWKKNEMNEFLAEFLGYFAGKIDGIYEESIKVELSAKKSGANVKVGKKNAVEMKFEWKNIDGSEE